MNIDFKLRPFPHVFIDKIYDENLYEKIWREINHLQPKMLPPSQTGAASDERGVPKKRGIGVFINDVYNKAVYSDIAVTSAIITSQQFKDQFKETLDNNFDSENSLETLYFKLYNRVDRESSAILLQLYMNGDYYRPHFDSSVFTSITLLHSKEKQYSGGELYFPEYDHTIDLNDNQMILFPSVVLHEVKEVKMQSNNTQDGRYTISILLSVNTTNPKD